MHRAMPLRKAFATSATDTSFASRIPTITEPSGDGIHELVNGASKSGDKDKGRAADVEAAILCMFYGAGADNATFDVRLIGWDTIYAKPTTLWIPKILASFTCTLSAMVGVAGAPLVATDRIVDTITLRTDNAVSQPVTKSLDSGAVTTSSGWGVEIFSPAGDLAAWVKVPLQGSRKLEFCYDMTGATDGNALFRFLCD